MLEESYKKKFKVQKPLIDEYITLDQLDMQIEENKEKILSMLKGDVYTII